MYLNLKISELPYNKNELTEFSKTDFLDFLCTEYSINTQLKTEIKICKLYNLYGNSKNEFICDIKNLDLYSKSDSDIQSDLQSDLICKKLKNKSYMQKLQNINPLFLKDKSDIYIYCKLYNIQIENNDFIFYSNLLYILQTVGSLKGFLDIPDLNKQSKNYILQTYLNDCIICNYIFQIRDDIKRIALLHLNPMSFYIYLLTDLEIELSLLKKSVVVDLESYRIRYIRMLNLYNLDIKILTKFLEFYKSPNIYKYILQNDICDLESRLIYNPLESLDYNIRNMSTLLGMHIFDYNYFISNFLEYSNVIYFEPVNTKLNSQCLKLYSDLALIRSLQIYVYHTSRVDLLYTISKYLDSEKHIFFLNLDYSDKKIFYGNINCKVQITDVRNNLSYKNSEYYLKDIKLDLYDLESLIKYCELILEKSEYLKTLNIIQMMKRL
jgi:hypothetical protein